MKQLIKDAALRLIKKNGGTTTLEVKLDLIQNQPQYFWKQADVSKTMMELQRDGDVILFHDNGTFRTYTTLGFVTQGVQKTSEKVSLTALAKLVQESVGKPIVLTHTKKSTGERNTMACYVLPEKNALGAFLLIENGQMKSVYPADLLSVEIDSKTYELKGK